MDQHQLSAKAMGKQKMIEDDGFDITDIRPSTRHDTIKSGVLKLLSEPEPKFPNLLLWDARGLELFRRITQTPEYYLTRCEMCILMKHSDAIASRIHESSVLVELGSRELGKTRVLLDALERHQKNIDYFALDLSEEHLRRTLQDIRPKSYCHVRIHGLIGSYSDAFAFLEMMSWLSYRPKCFMSLGSSLFNAPWETSVGVLSRLATAGRQYTEPEGQLHSSPTHESLSKAPLIIIGMDGCTETRKVEKAYNDLHDTNEDFIRNVLVHANHLVDGQPFTQTKADWGIARKWINNMSVHMQWLIPLRDVQVAPDLTLRCQNEILVASSYKYKPQQQKRLWEESKLRLLDCYADLEGIGYTLNVLEPMLP